MKPVHAQYLQRLGIISWERRDLPQPSAPHPSSANVDPEVSHAAPGACPQCGMQPSTNVNTGGRPDAGWMIVAEWDSPDDAFHGATGELFEKMLQAIGFNRDDVCLASAVKCTGEQPTSCKKHLNGLVHDPARAVVLCMGALAARNILNTTEEMESLRGKVQHHANGLPVIVTFHPEHLLRVPADKRKAWEDLQLAMRVTAGTE